MAIAGSGQIAASAINTELGRGSTSQISIDSAENGGYGRINNFSASRPSPNNPAAFSEWYGYNHNAGGESFEQLLGFDVSSLDRACINAVNRPRRYRTDYQEFPIASRLWSNISLTIFADAGWYGDGLSGSVRYWNGSSFTQNRFCRV